MTETDETRPEIAGRNADLPTMAAYYGITPTRFHLLIAAGVIPAGLQVVNDAVWDRFEVGECLRTLVGNVYFADVLDRDLIKIGFTADIYHRLTQLPSVLKSPVELLGYMPGTLAVENALHIKFEHLLVGQECFRVTDELLTYIDRLRTTEP